jgi:hypothetical protein
MRRESGSPVVREALLTDGDEIQKLHEEVGLPSRPGVDWLRLWRDNPAWPLVGDKPSIGWVLETGGEIVGFLGSIPLQYRYGEQTLTAVTAAWYAVRLQYRGYGLGLTAAFFKQDNVDIWLNTTANESSGKIFQAFQALHVPQEGFSTAYFWVLRPHAFLAAALRKVMRREDVARVGGILGSPLLWADTTIRRRKPSTGKRPSSTPVDISLLDVRDLDEEFDDLWSRKLNERKRLLALRTSETLRWHFDRPETGERVKVLCCRRDGRLTGYAIIAREHLTEIDLVRTSLVDIFVEHDEPEIVDRLLLVAHEYAAGDGSHVLEVIGFPENIRQRFLQSRPYSRKLPNWTYFYRVLDEDLGRDLVGPDDWYASLFDGDATL